MPCPVLRPMLSAASRLCAHKACRCLLEICPQCAALSGLLTLRSTRCLPCSDEVLAVGVNHVGRNGTHAVAKHHAVLCELLLQPGVHQRRGLPNTHSAPKSGSEHPQRSSADCQPMQRSSIQREIQRQSSALVQAAGLQHNAQAQARGRAGHKAPWARAETRAGSIRQGASCPLPISDLLLAGTTAQYLLRRRDRRQHAGAPSGAVMLLNEDSVSSSSGFQEHHSDCTPRMVLSSRATAVGLAAMDFPAHRRALLAAVAATALCATALVVVVEQARPEVGVLLPAPAAAARRQQLSWEMDADPAEDSGDAGFELDYGKESGVSAAMDSAKDDIADIRGMAGKADFDDDPVRQRLKKILREATQFEQEEKAYYKKIDAPAQVSIHVEQGSPGLQGPRGFRGPTGPQGALGDRGVQGPRGFVGPEGSEGLQGPQGRPGPTGDRGATGKRGVTGPRGGMGKRGKRGPNGKQGPPGAPGWDGPAGLRGADGMQGPQGPPGAPMPGPPGPMGPQGETGAPGTPGLKGATGPQGPQGDPGKNGPKGPQGPPGPDGKDYVP